MYDDYKITLKYFKAGVQESSPTEQAYSYDTQYMIANEQDIEFIFGRNEQFEGAFQEFTDTFIFIKDDRDYIVERRDDYLSRGDRDTYIIIEFYLLNRDTITYNLKYTGKLQFENTEIQQYYAECQFEVDDVINKIDKIQETEYSIEKDGIAYPYQISLAAVYNSFILSYWSGVVMETETFGTGEYFFTSSDINMVLSNADTDYKIFETYGDSNDYLRIYPFKTTENIIISKGLGCRFDMNDNDTGSYCDVIVRLYAQIDYKDSLANPADQLIYEESVTAEADGRYYLGVANEITIPLDSSRIVNGDTQSLNTEVKIILDNSSIIFDTFEQGNNPDFDVNIGSFTLGTTQGEGNQKNTAIVSDFGDQKKTSQIIAHPLRDIIDDLEVLIGIPINTDVLDGGLYDANNMLLTTARGVKGILPLTYNISFKDLFNSLKSFIALSLDYVDDTLYFRTIENAYYTLDQPIVLPDATSLVIQENDKNINLLTFGNSGGDSSNFDFGDLDFNSPRTYDLGLETEQEKKLTNSIRVDGATINKAAIDYDGVDVSIADRDDDKDLYLIARDMSSEYVESQFTLISGVDFQKFGQAINMELSPSRQLYNWRNYYAHLFTGLSEFNLTSWDKNKSLQYYDPERDNDIVDIPETISSNDGTAIFGKNLYIVEVPATSELYETIKAYKDGRFSFSFDGETSTGFLKQASINPLMRDIVSIELIQSA